MDQGPKDLLCFWCVHPLPQLPCLHLPVKYNDRTKVFGTIGNFCSWPCAKAYAINMNSARAGEIQSFLSLMRMQTFGKHVPLWAAPKREALACFGGTMTIEEFRSYGGRVEPPVVHYPFEKIYVVEIGALGGGTRTTRTNIDTSFQDTSGNGSRLRAIENSSAEGDTLKLKRNKPLVRSESKLETVLGIKRRGTATEPSGSVPGS